MKLRQNLLTGLLAAVLCVLAPLAVPMGPVPVTLATLGVYLAAGLLGPARGVTAVGVYLLLGALGVPVFAGFSGGVQQLVGVTGGFLWGYLPCVAMAGWLSHRISLRWLPLWLFCGTVALYAIGCGWYVWQTGAPLWSALAAVALPCLPGEIVKILVATGLIIPLKKWVDRLAATGVHKKEGF